MTTNEHGAARALLATIVSTALFMAIALRWALRDEVAPLPTGLLATLAVIALAAGAIDGRSGRTRRLAMAAGGAALLLAGAAGGVALAAG